MKRAILYARNSDPDYELNRGRRSARFSALGDSGETTVEQQITEGRALVESRGAALAEEDVHVEYMTGVDSLFERPEINVVRDKIRTGSYDLFVCYDTDRLARDPIETGLILKECMKQGCELQFVRMPLENSEVGMILLFMRGYGDRMEALKFRDRVRRHREACARAKRVPAANTAPFGYYNDFRVDPVTGKKTFTGSRAVDEEAAKLLLRMARWIAYDGMTATQVTLRLRREGVPCPAAHRGYRYRKAPVESCQWNSSKVCKLMRDPTYTGKTFVNQYRLTGKKNARGKFMQDRLPPSEWTLLTDDPAVTPVVIPQELFDLVQKRLDANLEGEHTTRNNRRPVLLRGLVFCAECGRKMYSTTHHKKTPVFRCSSYGLKNGFACPGTHVNRAELESKVWARAIEFYREPEVVEREVAALLEGLDVRQLETDLRIARGEIADRRRYLEDVVRRMLQASRAGRTLAADQLEEEASAVEDEIGRLERMASELQASVAAKDYVSEAARQFADYCGAYRAGFDGEIPFERKRDALAALRVKVLASSKRRPVMQVHLGALLGVVPRPATVAPASRPRP
jgi:site-specific DNA recombinase